MMLGKIESINEIFDFKIKPVSSLSGQNGSRLGMMQMLNAFMGCDSMDGYEVKTDKHTFYVLISNSQSCCESWGYFSSDDDLDYFVGKELLEIKLTDKALNQKVLEESEFYEEDGGIQFVDFITSDGVFQLAIYNAHNGYYGHGILVAKDSDILLNDTL